MSRKQPQHWRQRRGGGSRDGDFIARGDDAALEREFKRIRANLQREQRIRKAVEKTNNELRRTNEANEEKLEVLGANYDNIASDVVSVSENLAAIRKIQANQEDFEKNPVHWDSKPNPVSVEQQAYIRAMADASDTFKLRMLFADFIDDYSESHDDDYCSNRDNKKELVFFLKHIRVFNEIIRERLKADGDDSD